MIPTTKSKAKEETNQGPIKETSKWAQQSDLSGHAEKKVGKQYNGKRSVYTFNNCANNSEKAEKKIKLKGRWLVFNAVRWTRSPRPRAGSAGERPTAGWHFESDIQYHIK